MNVQQTAKSHVRFATILTLAWLVQIGVTLAFERYLFTVVGVLGLVAALVMMMKNIRIMSQP